MSDTASIFRQIGRAVIRGLEGLGRLFTFAVKGASKSSQESKLKKSIADHGRDTDRVYRELGKAYYELFGDAPAAELREFCERIDDNRAAQAEDRAKISDLNRVYEAERAGARDEARARREADRAAAERDRAEAAEKRRIAQEAALRAREEAALRAREEAEALREDDSPDIPSFMESGPAAVDAEEPTIRFEPAREPEVRRFEAAVPERPPVRAAAGKSAGKAVNYWWGLDTGVIDVFKGAKSELRVAVMGELDAILGDFIPGSDDFIPAPDAAPAPDDAASGDDAPVSDDAAPGDAGEAP